MIGELKPREIEALLRESRIARIAISPPPGGEHPLLVPIPCFYANGAFHVRSGPGQKIEAMRRNPHVTVEADRFRATNDWESVVAQGWYRELSTPGERIATKSVIEEMSGESLAIGENSILFQIIVTSVTGRFERPG